MGESGDTGRHRPTLEEAEELRELGPLALRYVADREQRKELSPAAARTVHYTLGTLVRFVGWERPVTRLRRVDIERWMQRDDLSAATLRCQLSIVRRFCRWLVENRYIRSDPTLGIARPRQPRYVPRGLGLPLVARALEAAPDRRAALVLTLMLQEALRCGEVAALQLGDIDFDERLMLVHGKGQHQRILPVTDETWTALWRYLEEFPASHGPLIRSYSQPTRGISAKHLSRLVSEWLHDAGLDASAHGLRHTAATDMLRAGAHVRDVQQALGHQSLATTQRYMPWLVGDLRKAMGGRSYRRPTSSTEQTDDDTA